MAKDADEHEAGQSATQAGVIPYRFVESGLEFCLVTTRRSNRWTFPKGQIDAGQSLTEAALEEALEEAGLRGTLMDDPVGYYSYRKKSQTQCVMLFLMHVDCCERKWKESGERDRAWVPLDEATDMLKRPKLVKLLQAAVNRLKAVQRDAHEGDAIRA